jgi:tripartite-type tricarboxylate transporter receptor subunit TctC
LPQELQRLCAQVASQAETLKNQVQALQGQARVIEQLRAERAQIVSTHTAAIKKFQVSE